MRRAPIAALVVVLASLASCAGQVQTVTVETPIPVYCTPPEIAAPALPIDALSPIADAFEVSRALWATIEVLEGYAGELRAAVEACRQR